MRLLPPLAIVRSFFYTEGTSQPPDCIPDSLDGYILFTVEPVTPETKVCQNAPDTKDSL